MRPHKDKRLRRILSDLQYWRKAIIRSFEEVNKGRYSEAHGREIREKVDKDKALIKRIDPLITAISELLELDPPKLGKVPRVTIKHV